ncbi:ComEA family DNA-binding protein [Nocardiopsis algeriensis]|uniref:Competence protein ComEA n=1 Tax=Nocardiopsis algeriensis TaxID=1478215 RepID=A0A841IZV3_9ACTN|nr:ComEA family DNA-binding protein [Nocardiopsis algeriensis]MBB6121975.1 competence protein ComEA [Nocardiopsis algeriensis]
MTSSRAGRRHRPCAAPAEQRLRARIPRPPAPAGAPRPRPSPDDVPTVRVPAPGHGRSGPPGTPCPEDDLENALTVRTPAPAGTAAPPPWAAHHRGRPQEARQAPPRTAPERLPEGMCAPGGPQEGVPRDTSVQPRPAPPSPEHRGRAAADPPAPTRTGPDRLPSAPYALAVPLRHDPRNTSDPPAPAPPLPEPGGASARVRRRDAGRNGEPAVRPSRPPVGYTEFLPDRQGTLLERLSRRWAPEATLSRRAVAALLTLGALAVAAVLFLGGRPTAVEAPEAVTPVAPAEVSPAASAAPAADLVVHVGGDVREPGLYTLPPDSRVSDAVEAAGGPLPHADLDLLNLARPLADGEQILVGVPQAAAAPGSPGPLVNLNLATQEELESLPRIGEVTAANIIAHREANGPFASVDDLASVDRVGPKTLDALRPLVTVG